MKRSIKLYSLLVMSMFFLLPQTIAQNSIWGRQLHATVNASYADKRGNYFVGGMLDTNSVFESVPMAGLNNSFIAKYRADGSLGWVKKIKCSDWAELTAIAGDSAGNTYVLGDFEDTLVTTPFQAISDIGINSYFLAKYDSSGNCLWLKTWQNHMSVFEYDIRLTNVACDKDDSVYIYGYCDRTYNLDGIPMTVDSGRVFFAKLSPTNGTAVWARPIRGSLGCIFNTGDMVADAQNNIVIGGNFYNYYPAVPLYCIFNHTDTLHVNLTRNFFSYLAKYDKHGNFIWSQALDSLDNNTQANFGIDRNNNIFVGTSDYVAKYSAAGNMYWLDTLPYMSFITAFGVGATGCYYYDYTSTLHKIDTASGDVLWETSLHGVMPTHASLSAGKNGALLLTGTDFRLSASGITMYDGNKLFGYLLVLDDTTVVPAANNRITGNVFNDTIADCVHGAEPGLLHYGIVATPGPYYTTTDANGNYSLPADTGTYTVQAVPFYSYTALDSSLCPSPTYTVHLPTTGIIDTGNNFAKKHIMCQRLFARHADTGTNCVTCNSTIRRYLDICNYGGDTARNVTVEIQYPLGPISPVHSSIPWTSYDAVTGIMNITIGDMAPDSCLQLVFDDTMVCSIDTLTWFPYVFSAKVLPMNSCYAADTLYNKASRSMFYCISVGVHTPAKEIPFTLYPNPAGDHITIDGLTEATSVEIRDVFGRSHTMVAEQLNKTLTLDISGYAPGVYIAVVRSGNVYVTKKFVKL